MQPQQQIFQPQAQVFPQNQNVPYNSNIVVQNNNLPQVIQTESPNKCEKMSKFITGSANIPLVVFIILMSSFYYHFSCVLFNYGFLSSYLIMASFLDFLFALFIWSRMAIKIEENSSSVKYGYLYLINLIILSFITITFPLKRVWNFILFETLLIAFNNKDKKLNVLCFKMSGNSLIIFTIVYHIICNPFHIFSILVTIGYAYVYKKYLLNKINISNERIQIYENNLVLNCLKNKFKTFISLEDVLIKERNRQLNQNSNINNNSNMIHNNMYPNYYSGIQQNIQNQVPNQQGIPLQQNLPNAQQNNDLNQSSSRYDLANTN